MEKLSQDPADTLKLPFGDYFPGLRMKSTPKGTAGTKNSVSPPSEDMFHPFMEGEDWMLQGQTCASDKAAGLYHVVQAPCMPSIKGLAGLLVPTNQAAGTQLSHPQRQDLVFEMLTLGAYHRLFGRKGWQLQAPETQPQYGLSKRSAAWEHLLDFCPSPARLLREGQMLATPLSINIGVFSGETHAQLLLFVPYLLLQVSSPKYRHKLPTKACFHRSVTGENAAKGKQLKIHSRISHV